MESSQVKENNNNLAIKQSQGFLVLQGLQIISLVYPRVVSIETKLPTRRKIAGHWHRNPRKAGARRLIEIPKTSPLPHHQQSEKCAQADHASATLSLTLSSTTPFLKAIGVEHEPHSPCSTNKCCILPFSASWGSVDSLYASRHWIQLRFVSKFSLASSPG